jgi:hypothetical protein
MSADIGENDQDEKKKKKRQRLNKLFDEGSSCFRSDQRIQTK